MPISPGSTHAHTRGMIPCTPVLSQVIYYTYKTKKTRWWVDTCHQSRSATYTSGSVPRSLFKIAWLCWIMTALQHAACGGVLVMVQHLRLAEVHCMSSLEHMLCQVDVWTSPFFSARRCSLTHCLRLLPVWLMYMLEHSTQGMEYTTHSFAFFD